MSRLRFAHGWRSAVFKRDNYVCQVCSNRGGRLHAHHLDSWSAYPLRRIFLDNGTTLCIKCHKDFHSRYGNDVTKEDFINYIS
jgi:5-methylcytosine-specific restriction endonuclease McrA